MVFETAQRKISLVAALLLFSLFFSSCVAAESDRGQTLKVPESEQYNYNYGRYLVTAVPDYSFEERKNEQAAAKFMDYYYHPPKTKGTPMMIYPLMLTTGDAKIYDATSWWGELMVSAGYKAWGDGYKTYQTLLYDGSLEKPREIQIGSHTHLAVAPNPIRTLDYFVAWRKQIYSYRNGKRPSPTGFLLQGTKYRGGVLLLNSMFVPAFVDFGNGSNTLSYLHWQDGWKSIPVRCGSGNADDVLFQSNALYNVFVVRSGDTLHVCRLDDVQNAIWENMGKVRHIGNSYGLYLNGDQAAVCFVPDENSVSFSLYSLKEKQTVSGTVFNADGDALSTQCALSFDNRHLAVLFVVQKRYQNEDSLWGRQHISFGDLLYAVVDIEKKMQYPSPFKRALLFTGAHRKSARDILIARNLTDQPDLLLFTARYFYDSESSTIYTSAFAVDELIANVLSSAQKQNKFETIPGSAPILRGWW